jgi:FMN phosphatase YigB (HAD superfamily)
VSLTLLLDLDNTLLTNSVDTFVPAYMKALSEFMTPYVNPERFFGALLYATRQMVQNQDPDCYLKDVFDANFYPRLGVSAEDLRSPLERFYAEVFPTLKILTEAIPESIQLVDEALKRNYQIVIATNPLFPFTAIEQRLNWAGLSLDQYPFAFVPSYESVHFAKPNPALLAELLARLGWSPEPVVMVGDDQENDIRCAQELGLPTYLVNENGANQDSFSVHGAGKIEQLLNWLDSRSIDQLKPDFSSPSALIAILRATPASLQSLCWTIQADLWNQRNEPGEWCQAEILCHLRDVETEVNLPRLEKVIRESNPFIPGHDTDPWADEREYIKQSGMQALGQFSASRKNLLALLSRLKPEDWRRPARHAIFGPTTLHELVSIITGHDQLHIQQLKSFIETTKLSTP